VALARSRQGRSGRGVARRREGAHHAWQGPLLRDKPARRGAALQECLMELLSALVCADPQAKRKARPCACASARAFMHVCVCLCVCVCVCPPPRECTSCYVSPCVRVVFPCVGVCVCVCVSVRVHQACACARVCFVIVVVYFIMSLPLFVVCVCASCAPRSVHCIVFFVVDACVCARHALVSKLEQHEHRDMRQSARALAGFGCACVCVSICSTN
jgi:hypothetical protein